MDIVTLTLAKNYSNKVGSTIQGTSYDYDTGKLTFNTADGDWSVKVNNGMNATYKQTLDNVKYDATDVKPKTIEITFKNITDVLGMEIPNEAILDVFNITLTNFLFSIPSKNSYIVRYFTVNR